MSTGVVSALIGAVVGGLVSFIVNIILDNKKMKSYQQAFMSPYKIELLKLPTYLEGATFMVDHHGRLTIEKRVEESLPELKNELKYFINIIEKIFKHNNSIYLDNRQLKILYEMYEDTGKLLNRLNLENTEIISWYKNHNEDPLKTLSEKYYKKIRKLEGIKVEKNKSYEIELESRTYN